MNTIDKVRNIRISDYNYPLPDHRIAKHPLAAREQCKLLCYKVGGEISEGHFYDVPAVLPEKAMLVYNNTRVINARLRFRKSTGSTIEIFCLEPVAPCDYQLIFQTTQSCTWLCLVGNSKRWKQGPLTQELEVDGKTVTLEANRGERRGNSFEIEFSWNGGVTFASILEAIGEIPIPPYLNRGTESTDSSDYQTVYSHIDGSVAAPTAGLHFTEEVLAECDKRGITRRELTLHVGAGHICLGVVAVEIVNHILQRLLGADFTRCAVRHPLLHSEHFLVGIGVGFEHLPHIVEAFEGAHACCAHSHHRTFGVD